MAGEYDAQLNVGVKLDTNSAINQFSEVARRIESRPVRVRFDAPLGQITGKVNDFEKSLAAASSRVIAFGASAGQVYLVSRALDELVRSTIDVQKELANIGVILGLSGNQLNQFSSQLFGVANLTAQSFKNVADVALLFSRQGLGVEETLKRTAAAFTLVRIGGVDAEDAVKAITTTLNTFNEVGLDAIGIANRIAAVDSRFSVSGAVIVDSLTRVASTAEETGVSFNNLIGVTTALQQITSRGGTVIGNSLKSIFTRIERPETIDQLNKMGIATEDLNGKMLGADAILSNLAKKYKDLSYAQQQQINQLAAGLFQINQFKALIGDLAKDNGIAARASQAAAGASDQAVRRQQELNKTLAAQYQVAVNNATQFAAKIGNIAIAPALTNVFKGINAATGPEDEVGKFLGEGILKGLGNYLSGPGLALAGILASKLFLAFSSQAARSFAQILEVGTTRIQNERTINELLSSQPGAYEKINAAAGNEAKQQQIILDILNEQNIALNAKAAAAASAGALVGKSFAGIPLTDKPLAISGEKVVASGGRFAGFSALSDAIDRERRAGIDVSQIRVGQSGQLISSDNPLGIGIYNLKDEPLGINQGINRVVQGGGNPKKAGDIPNFAAPLETIGSPSLLPIAEKAFQDLKDGITKGLISFEQIPTKIDKLGEDFSLTTKSLSTITRSLNTVVQNAEARAAKLALPGQQLIGINKGYPSPIGPQQELSFPFQFPNLLKSNNQLLLPEQSEATRAAEIERIVKNIQLENGVAGNSLLGPFASSQQLKALQTQNFSSRVSKLGIGSSLLGFLPNSQYSQLKTESDENGYQGVFNRQKQAIAGRALLGSFILPLLAGTAQEGSEKLLGKDSPTARGVSASIGAAGNIGAYALTGLGLTGGNPLGALAGAGVGAALELPAAIKAFSDTLPDLLKHLDDLKESTTKVNDAFSGYITTSNQLASIQSGEQKVSVGTYRQLQNNQSQFLSNLPAAAQDEIRKNPSNIYDIASRYNNLNQQKQNALSNTIDLIKNPLTTLNSADVAKSAFTSFIGGNTSINGASFASNIGSKAIQQQLDIESRVKPAINSILGYQNQGGSSLQTLLQTLNPNDIGRAFKPSSFTLNSDQTGLKNPYIENFLKSQNFDQDYIKNIVQQITKISKSGKLGASTLSNSFSQKTIQDNAKNAQDYIVAQEQQEKELDTLNSKLANLTVTGTAAINDFEINVISRLANSLTKLKLQGIESTTASRINEINSGSNDYNKTFFDYQRNNISAQNQFGQETNKAQSDFTTKVGNDFYNIIDNFTKGLAGTGKNKATDLNDLSENKRTELNSVLDGFFTIDKNFKASLTDKGQNINTSDISNISNNIQSKISQLENIKNTQGNSLIPDAATLLGVYPKAKTVQEAINLSGSSSSELSSKLASLPDKGASILSLTPETIDDANTARQNLDEIIKSYQALLGKLTQNSADLKKGLTEAQNNLDSALAINSKQLYDNFNILSKQFISDESNKDFDTSLKSQYSAKAFGLSRQAQISNPVTAIKLNAQSQLQPQIASILDSLNISTKLGIQSPDDITSAITNQKSLLSSAYATPLTPSAFSLKGNTNSIYDSESLVKTIPNISASVGDASGKIQSLIGAENELTRVRKLSSDEIDKEIQSLSKFTDVQAGLVLQSNISKAGQGALTGSDFGRAALAPLQYNTETFNRDAITSVQEFSAEIKDDLGKNLLEVTRGAQNASQAFRDLGLSLAESLESKAVNIGINSLFGAATSGAGSLFKDFSNKAKGGYIQKFARGGFVNMGSGTKDDVPAYLSGGEFVINRNAVSKIGKSNLDALNSPHMADGGTFRQPSQFATDTKKQRNNIGLKDFQGVTSDTINSGSNSADITLSNAFVFNGNSGGTKGKLDTSSLLSSIGASDQNDPQNKLKFARQKYALSRTEAEKQYQQQLAAYNVSQYIGLGQAYLGAAGSVIGGVLSSPGTGVGDGGAEPGGGGFNPNDEAGNAAATFGSSDSQPYFTSFKAFNSVQAKGGYIPKFASGGHFGGDSSSDKFRAMVMGGEYVVSPQTVNKYGSAYFNGLNNTAKYASGGYVGSSSYGGSDQGSTQMINLLTQISNKLGAGNSNVAPTATAGAQPQSPSQTNHVTINLGLNQNGTTTNESSSTSSTGGSNTSAADQQNLKKIGDQLKAQTIQILTSESRPGGLLDLRFARKTT